MNHATKGVSPLLAAVFLVAMAVTLIPIFSGWYTSTVTSTTDSIGNQTDTSIKCNAAAITIEDVYLDITDNRARINVRNSGFSTEHITSAKIYAANGSEAPNLSTYPINITRGDYISL